MFTERRTHTHCTGHRPIRLVLSWTVELIWGLSGVVQELNCSQTFMVSWVTFLGLTLILFAAGRKFWLAVKTPTLTLCCITLRFCFRAIAEAQGTHKPVLGKCSMKSCGCKSTWGQVMSMWDGSGRTKAQPFNSRFWEAMSELPWDPHGDAVPGLCSPGPLQRCDFGNAVSFCSFPFPDSWFLAPPPKSVSCAKVISSGASFWEGKFICGWEKRAAGTTASFPPAPLNHSLGW